MLIGALGWAVAFMPVSPSSALRIPDAGPDDSHSPPYLHQPLHDGGRGHPGPTADPRSLLDDDDDDDDDDDAVCAPIAGAS